MALHRKRLGRLFPVTWTHVANLDFVYIAFNMKLYGIDVRNGNDLADTILQLQSLGIVEHDKTNMALLRRCHE